MPRSWCCCVLLSLLAAAACAAPAVVYVQGPDGKWLATKGEQAGGKVTVRLGASQVGSGTVNLVVNKPAWMVLEDREAPKLAWLKVNGLERKPQAAHDLGVVSRFPLVLSLGLRDNANPLDGGSVRLEAEGPLPGLQGDVSALGFPRTSGRVTFTVPRPPPGRYRGVLRVADLSPAANTLEVPLSFTVTGVNVSADRQTISLVAAGGTYRLQARGQETLQAGNGPAAYLTVNVGGQHMYLDKITAVTTLEERPGLISVRVTGLPGQTDKEQDGTKLARIEYDLTLRDDVPCLLVKSRTVNLGPRAELYCWWGWLPGASYTDPAGEHSWSGKYADVGKVGWVFLPATSREGSGLGWLSPLVFGESRFNTMLLYTDPQKIPTDTNAAVEAPFALMSASSAAEVAAAAAKIKALGLW